MLCADRAGKTLSLANSTRGRDLVPNVKYVTVKTEPYELPNGEITDKIIVGICL